MLMGNPSLCEGRARTNMSEARPRSHTRRCVFPQKQDPIFDAEGRDHRFQLCPLRTGTNEKQVCIVELRK